MRIKTYIVYIRNTHEWYYVDAPSKRIARWCGAACYNNEYAAFKTAKNCQATRFIYKEIKDD